MLRPNRSLAGEDVLPVSYVLPIAASSPQTRALGGYLRRLSRQVAEVIVVDGSPDPVFAAHARDWGDHVRHMRPRLKTPNGKVGGVITGVLAASREHVVIADDDVRYRRAELARAHALLENFDIVRPQNWFRPLPWHARWDTARSLLNRLGGGDWPGTLALRRSRFIATGGYAGDVMFENLELVRTMAAAGGRECVAQDLFVVRRPPAAGHFARQRIRQAYDEWARPARLLAQLAILPAAIALLRRGRTGTLGALVLGSIAAAELGRRKGGAREVFPPASALWAPAWLGERAVTAWLAVAARLLRGGVRYRSQRLRRAATPPAELRARQARRALAAPEDPR